MAAPPRVRNCTQPYGVAVDSKNNVYIADYGEHVIRKVSSGTITTIAGIGGIAGYSGDGGPATNALLYQPVAVAVDPAGNVFIADYNNCRIREVNAATGIITTVAGTGQCAFTGDGLATSSGLGYPQGVAVDANDNLFISDYFERVRWVSPNGLMTTIAGTGVAGYNGDGGLATSALLYEPTGITLDAAGDVLVSDYNNGRVRSITAFPALGTSTGNMSFGLTAVGSTSSPETLVLSAYGPVTISNISTTANFSEADDCPATMANGTTCTMYVYFVPTASGNLTGSVTVNSNGFFSQVNNVNLTGLGSSISLTGAPLSFREPVGADHQRCQNRNRNEYGHGRDHDGCHHVDRYHGLHPRNEHLSGIRKNPGWRRELHHQRNLWAEIDGIEAWLGGHQ